MPMLSKLHPPGVVLFPGATLPLRLIGRIAALPARMALSAPPQYAGLLVVVRFILLFLTCIIRYSTIKFFSE